MSEFFSEGKCREGLFEDNVLSSRMKIAAFVDGERSFMGEEYRRFFVGCLFCYPLKPVGLLRFVLCSLAFENGIKKMLVLLL